MESCDGSIKYDTLHLASNVYKSLISQNEVFDMEYLTDKLLINDFLSFFLYILPDPLSSIIGRCTLYTPGCRMKAYK